MTLANASVIVTAHMHAYEQYKLKNLIESRINLLCASVGVCLGALSGRNLK
jgi:hypothetical protein